MQKYFGLLLNGELRDVHSSPRIVTIARSRKWPGGRGSNGCRICCGNLLKMQQKINGKINLKDIQ
jgi:hypothetical protein